MKRAFAILAGMALLVAPLAAVVVLTQQGPSRVFSSLDAAADIPGPMLALYQQAAALRCPGLPWPVLAAVGKVETNHGRNTRRSSAGAEGPMQFLPSTWARYGIDGDGDRRADIFNPVDAVHSAARYLCLYGGALPGSLRRAIWGYNHADWYVDLVLFYAARYGMVGSGAARGDVRGLLANPRLVLTPMARADLAEGVVDGRVVALLASATQYHTVGVSVFRSGHDRNVAGTDRVSQHFCGQAADVFMVDGDLVSPRSASSRAFVDWLRGLPGAARPSEVGQPWRDLEREPGFFTDEGHQDHVHVGYGPHCPG